MRFLTRPTALAAVLVPLVGGSAAALPVLYEVTPASTFSAGVTLAGHPLVRTSLANVRLPDFTLAGTIADTPNGRLYIDWGHPGWDGVLAIPEIGPSSYGPIVLANQGSLDGAVHFDFSPFGSVDIGFQWAVDQIALTGGGFSGPTVPSTPGPGPWSAMGLLDADLDIEGQFQVTLFGLHPGVDVGGDVALDDFPLSLTLERGGDFLDGSQASFDLDVPGALPLPSSLEFPVPGCEVPGPFGTCLFDFFGVDFHFTTAQITDLSVFLVAESFNRIVVPEPPGAWLAASAIACLFARRRAHTRTRRG